ncbi:hypothetical protein ONZ51_g13226 [Trametes cubensis]|uniref:chitin deacetylase n=1 Tax=Trametes cubensis TaxID=1111947 RepID=A0AAD7TEI0_9APHY|nr:hypothetical protein ONZ51_g13226 [Trametes cubensis]
MNHGMLALHAQHNSDQAALSYLEDLWIVRDPVESRCFTLEFSGGPGVAYFKENPYFSNTVLKKEYKYVPPPVESDDKPDADGITETMLEFSWERDVQPQATKIDWKDDSKNLTKLHPRVKDDEEDDMPSEGGSFFNFFEVAEDPFDIGVTIANDVFPEAIEYFLGHAGGDDVDSDEEDEESDDENEEEIDLEKPRPKKQKKAPSSQPNRYLTPSRRASDLLDGVLSPFSILRNLTPFALYRLVMKLAAVSAVALPALVSAHGLRDVHHARQAAAPAGSASSPAASGTASGSAATAATGAATGATTGAPAAATGSLTFTLASTNPSAVPLSDIVSGASSQATVAATTTFTGGTVPTYLPNAPALPDALSLIPSNYPALDKVPPTDSPEVQQWIQEVQNSGVEIPNIQPTVAGGCPANPEAAADTSRCWWTCGGCTADGDIESCPDKLTWGLTYDDGPALYTGDLLHYLDTVNLKATFFVVGSRAISYPSLLQEEYMAQHQIAVHTWSHPPMTTLTNEQIIAEFGWSKKIIKDVLGVTPTYWRPPYGDVDNRVRAIAKAMGLQTSIWTRISPSATFDTGDFDIAGGLTTSTQVLNNWQSIMGNATTIDTGFIVLEHDLFQQTVDIATGYILPEALAHQPPFKIEPIVSCLNKPMADAYIETNDNKSNPIGSAPATGSAGGAQTTGSGNSSGAAAGGKNGAMGIAAPSSMGAIALALVSGVVALFL